MSRLQKKPPAHKRGHPTLQNMNFFYFCGSFLRIRTQITDPDPDPMVRLNTDPIRIRIRIRIRNPGYFQKSNQRSEANWLILKIDNIEAKRTGSIVILSSKKHQKSELSFFLKTKGKKRKGSIVNYRSFAIPSPFMKRQYIYKNRFEAA